MDSDTAFVSCHCLYGLHISLTQMAAQRDFAICLKAKLESGAYRANNTNNTEYKQNICRINCYFYCEPLGCVCWDLVATDNNNRTYTLG